MIAIILALTVSGSVLNPVGQNHAVRQQLLSREDVISFAVPGCNCDDARCVGGGVSSNGAFSVAFKEFKGAALEVDVDPKLGATDYALTDVTEKGMRRVTIAKKGAKAPVIRSVAQVHRNCLLGRTTRETPLYAPNEEMTFTVRLSGFAGSDRSRLFLSWKRSGDDGKTESGRAVMTEPFVYRTSLDRPGFVRFEGKLVDADGKTVTTVRNGNKEAVICDLGAGVDIERIRPAVPAPSDFDAFWRARREKLAKTAWRGREILEEIPSPLADVALYKLKVPCVEGVDMTGYFARPRKDGKWGAMACFQGYGASFSASNTQPPSAETLKRAGECLFLIVSPHGFELGREPDYYRDFRRSIRSNGCEHGFDPVQNADPEKPYYCGMSYRVLRSLDYLKSRPEWNGRDLTVTGGSQGGLQSIWCAALDHDVTVCDVFIPWNCDIGGTELGRNRGNWYAKWVPALGYYDCCSMAPRIPKTCHVNVSMAGLGDYICPPTGVMAFYNSVTAPKKITFVQNAQHGNRLESRPQTFELQQNPVRHSAEVQEVLGGFVERGEIAGVISVLSDKDYNETWDLFGYADVEGKRRMAPDTMFAVFSMSKTFLGAAMMCAIDDGVISLDDPVSKFLPEYADIRFKNGRKPKRALTVRDITCHVDGLRNDAALRDLTLNLREVARQYAAQPLAAEPGETFKYGTARFSVAGACLEVATGKRYEDFLAERILRPLGMKDTTFEPNREQIARMVKPYTTRGGPFRPADDACSRQLVFPRPPCRAPSPGGGLFSTAADMIRFSQMLAHHGEYKGKTIISRKTFDGIFSVLQVGPHIKQPYTCGAWRYGDWFGHEGAMRTDQRANLRTGESRVFFIQTENAAGKAFFDAKIAWHKACDVYQREEIPFADELVKTHENDVDRTKWYQKNEKKWER